MPRPQSPHALPCYVAEHTEQITGRGATGLRAVFVTQDRTVPVHHIQPVALIMLRGGERMFYSDWQGDTRVSPCQELVQSESSDERKGPGA
jgi:hypothetical protein